ncbi:uncharacterized protein METZ01_LOCUS319560 [marine metagenome]|uniref:Uncharacterized protein n=1 Tax=marine metagenome TaxID=408172 RepID=A0A382P074_9ZZZZ
MHSLNLPITPQTKNPTNVGLLEPDAYHTFIPTVPPSVSIPS